MSKEDEQSRAKDPNDVWLQDGDDSSLDDFKKDKSVKRSSSTHSSKAPDALFLDLVDRDPTRMNDHLKITFEDVFAEPEGTHSFDSVWLCSYKTFRVTKLWCYRVLSAVCAVPAAFCWGAWFACLFFTHIWYVVPCLRSFSIQLWAVNKVFTTCIRTFYDPCYDSCGRVFSHIRVTLLKE